VPLGRISSASGVPGLCGHHRRGAGRLVTLLLIARQCQNVASAVTLRISEFAVEEAIQGCVDALQICTIAPARAEQKF
jgi:hypothetical protein